MCEDRNLYVIMADTIMINTHFTTGNTNHGTIPLFQKNRRPVIIPEILFEAANIEDGDFFKIYIRKMKK